eukprot:356883-Chlamydomonas_euryale.AAC.2
MWRNTSLDCPPEHARSARDAACPFVYCVSRSCKTARCRSSQIAPELYVHSGGGHCDLALAPATSLLLRPRPGPEFVQLQQQLLQAQTAVRRKFDLPPFTARGNNGSMHGGT